MTKKGYKPSRQETDHRRDLIREMVLNRGITNRAEIRRRLESEHGIKVTPQTIYRDWKAVAALHPDKVKEFHFDLIGRYKQRIRELDIMIAKEHDSSKKASLMRTQSQMMKDMGFVSAQLATEETGTTRKPKRPKPEEKTKIIFGEPEVKKND